MDNYHFNSNIENNNKIVLNHIEEIKTCSSKKIGNILSMENKIIKT
jgi:hypothetical protein